MFEKQKKKQLQLVLPDAKDHRLIHLKYTIFSASLEVSSDVQKTKKKQLQLVLPGAKD